MFKIIGYMILGFLGYSLYKGYRLFEQLRVKPGERFPGHEPQAEIDEMVQDPVCGMYIPRKQAIARKIGTETHFFCSEECLNKFLENRNN